MHRHPSVHSASCSGTLLALQMLLLRRMHPEHPDFYPLTKWPLEESKHFGHKNCTHNPPSHKDRTLKSTIQLAPTSQSLKWPLARCGTFRPQIIALMAVHSARTKRDCNTAPFPEYSPHSCAASTLCHVLPLGLSPSLPLVLTGSGVRCVSASTQPTQTYRAGYQQLQSGNTVGRKQQTWLLPGGRESAGIAAQELRGCLVTGLSTVSALPHILSVAAFVQRSSRSVSLFVLQWQSPKIPQPKSGARPLPPPALS